MNNFPITITFNKVRLLTNLLIVVGGGYLFHYSREYFNIKVTTQIIMYTLLVFGIWTLFSLIRMLKPALVINETTLYDNTNIFSQNKVVQKTDITSIEMKDKYSRTGHLKYIEIKYLNKELKIYGENLSMTVPQIYDTLKEWSGL